MHTQHILIEYCQEAAHILQLLSKTKSRKELEMAGIRCGGQITTSIGYCEPVGGTRLGGGWACSWVLHGWVEEGCRRLAGCLVHPTASGGLLRSLSQANGEALKRGVVTFLKNFRSINVLPEK